MLHYTFLRVISWSIFTVSAMLFFSASSVYGQGAGTKDIYNNYSLKSAPMKYSYQRNVPQQMLSPADAVYVIRFDDLPENALSAPYIAQGQTSEKVFSDFHSCKNLGFLAYDRKAFPSYKSDFGSFPELREISISGGFRKEDLADIFRAARHLRTISITNLMDLPEEITQLSELEVLEIHARSLKAIGYEKIAYLKHLKYVKIIAADSMSCAGLWSLPNIEVIDLVGYDESELGTLPDLSKSKLKKLSLENVGTIRIADEGSLPASIEILYTEDVAFSNNFFNQANQLTHLRAIHFFNVDLDQFPP